MISKTFSVKVRFENGIEMDFDKAKKIISIFSMMDKDDAESIREDIYWNRFSLTQVYTLRAFKLEISDIQPLVISSHSDKEFKLSSIHSISINGMTFDWDKVEEKINMLDSMSRVEIGLINEQTAGMVVNLLLSLKTQTKFNPFM